MVKKLARICVREGQVCGLFIPLKDNNLKQGVYEIREILGELIVVRIGDPIMSLERYNGLSLENLYDERSQTAITKEEQWK